MVTLESVLTDDGFLLYIAAEDFLVSLNVKGLSILMRCEELEWHEHWIIGLGQPSRPFALPDRPAEGSPGERRRNLQH